MTGTIRHCPTCGCQAFHRHIHDTASSISAQHIHGTERFECVRCGRPTFAHSEGASRFPFVLDDDNRRAAFSHAMVRP